MTHELVRYGLFTKLVRRAPTKTRIGLLVAAMALPVPAFSATTQYLYDDLGRLVLVENHDGSTIVYAHDENGNVLSITRAVPSPPSAPSSMAWLMGFEGLDGGAPNDDESSHNRVVTVGGGAQIDTGVVLVGASSLLLDGSGDYVRVADDPVFEADGAFVAEVTLRRNDTGRNQVIFGKRNSGAQHGWTLNINASNQLQAVAWSSGNSTPVLNIASVATLTTGFTYQVAVERTAGGLWTIFLGGAIAAQGTETAAPTGNSEPLYLGRDATNTSRDFAGWMDEARFCREALYDATAYTPWTGPFPR